MIAAGPFCSKDTMIQLRTMESGGVFTGPGVSSNGSFDPGAANLGLNKILYQITYPGGCFSKDSMDIEVRPSPNNTFVLNPDKGCDPLEVVFETEQETQIVWRLNSVTYNTPKVTALLKTGKYLLTLEVTNSVGCKQSLSDSIIVYRPPTADFSYTPSVVYISNPVYFFKDKSLGNVIGWKWYFGDEDSSENLDPNHRYSKSGSYDVQLYVVDGNGCVDSIAQKVQVLDEVLYFLPTAITPNFDGKNDEFRISGIGYEKASIQIFNRWGEKIFESDNFTSWDATYKGEIVQNEVYVYILTILDNKKLEHYEKGTIKVIR